MRQAQPEAWRTAHGRLFDHLCETTPPRPDTLDGLQPLYQAVVHGCLAGRQQEACDKVYFERILRGTGADGFYSSKKLGAISADLGAVAAFFDAPWDRVSANLTAPDRAWLLNEAAFSLRALSRLTEALGPMRAGLEMAVQQQDWNNAAIYASNLSELEVTLGRLPAALADARAAVAYADRSGDTFQRMGIRTTAADVLHQSGDSADDRAEAGGLFAEAERMQKERQPQSPLLYSVQGFRYCDWLLAPAEGAAWAALLRRRSVGPGSAGPSGSVAFQPATGIAGFQPPTGTTGPRPPIGSTNTPSPSPPAPAAQPSNTSATTGPADPNPPNPTDPVAACDEVERRATTTLKWMIDNRTSLLDIALDHLTLARVTLLRDLLSAPPTPPGPGRIMAPADPGAIEQAITGLRNANMLDQLPKALLTAAWTQALRGAPDLARAALDEAWSIAERGPMPLYQADVLLYRVRLWTARPWAGQPGVPAPPGGHAGGSGQGQAEGCGEVGGCGELVGCGERERTKPAPTEALDAAAAYPWPDTTPAADLAEARRLIEQHGYGRRLPELAEAEAALARG